MTKLQREYTPPIPWRRLDAMIRAVLKQRQSATDIALALRGELRDAAIDASMCDEIMAALYALQAVYQRELAKTLPPRRTDQADLMDSAIVRYLRDTFDVTLDEAIRAATGAAPRVALNSAHTTYRKHNRVLGSSGIGGIEDMRTWLTRVRWSTRRLRRMGIVPKD